MVMCGYPLHRSVYRMDSISYVSESADGISEIPKLRFKRYLSQVYWEWRL